MRPLARAITRTALTLCLLVLCGCGAQDPEEPAPATTLTGPVLGHVGATVAHVWIRAEPHGTWELRLGSGKSVEAESTAESDGCITFRLTDLPPDTDHTYTIRYSGHVIVDGGRFRTAPAVATPQRTRIAFGSCASWQFEKQPVWERIRASGVHAMVLLGDTPYIDSTNLATQRERYRRFFEIDDLKRLFRTTPVYGTWDDHDFGRNDTDGRLPGKENSRRAFIEYRPNPSFGDGKEGIYTSFRRGPVEVWLLDTRWFARTDAGKKGLLGTRQWAWLENGLATSTAPFKILACGMIWNGSVRPGKPDHWGSYPGDRERLLRILQIRKITGVTLVGGDIHRQRVVRHATKARLGYDLVELITSPLANTIIAAANQPHPGLLFDGDCQEMFLLLDADARKASPTLSARLISAAGETLFALDL